MSSQGKERKSLKLLLRAMAVGEWKKRRGAESLKRLVKSKQIDDDIELLQERLQHPRRPHPVLFLLIKESEFNQAYSLWVAAIKRHRLDWTIGVSVDKGKLFLVIDPKRKRLDYLR